eukprot:scaffold65451_cov75-Phaeocystis_antarctica.AAC.1
MRLELGDGCACAHIPEAQRSVPLAAVARERVQLARAVGRGRQQRAEEARRRARAQRVREREGAEPPELQRGRVERGQDDEVGVERDARDLARPLALAALLLECQPRQPPPTRAPVVLHGRLVTQRGPRADVVRQAAARLARHDSQLRRPRRRGAQRAPEALGVRELPHLLAHGREMAQHCNGEALPDEEQQLAWERAQQPVFLDVGRGVKPRRARPARAAAHPKPAQAADGWVHVGHLTRRVLGDELLQLPLRQLGESRAVGAQQALGRRGPG